MKGKEQHTSVQAEKNDFDRLLEDDTSQAKEIKVVGKIDLDALNQRTRPKKKTKEQLVKERIMRTKKRKSKA